MKSSWREYARPIIAKVIAEHQGDDIKAIRKALHAAYPFGERARHPHKIWLDECAIQLGKKKPHPRLNVAPLDPNQTKMF